MKTWSLAGTEKSVETSEEVWVGVEERGGARNDGAGVVDLAVAEAQEEADELRSGGRFGREAGLDIFKEGDGGVYVFHWFQTDRHGLVA